MIIEPTPFIVAEEDSCTGPITTLHYAIDLLYCPILAYTDRIARMLAISHRRDKPGESGQVPRLGVCDEVFPGYHMLSPVKPITDMVNRIISRPDISAF